MDALRLAAELEHGLMCQYLFAAYSLKRYPYERFDGSKKKKEVLSEAELERVRRWAMKVTLIARQEMEHLGLALNLLSSIGGTPSFSRPNMPQRLEYYGEAKIKLELTTCDLDTIKRFQKFEAPNGLDPDKPGEAKAWCERMKGGASPEQVYDAISAGEALEGAPHVDLYGVPFQDVQELYEAIDRGFTEVSASIGEASLFIGKKENQIYGGPPSPLYGSMNDLNQYGLSLIAVTDLASARKAIRTIVEQGEGIKVPPSYLAHTHFCLFTEIRAEMEANRGRLATIGARPVVRNPMTRLQPDVTAPASEVTLLTNKDTLAVAELFNQCYEVMLLLLLYLYSDQVKTEDQQNGLMDAAFFPFMTMFVRPLAEILTELPAFANNDPSTTAGPGFELAGDVVLFPNLEQTWSLFQERIDALVLGFRVITARRALPSPDESIEPVRPKWGWVPAHDPWLKLPSQQFEEVRHERKQLWNKVKQEGTTIQPDEVASNAGVGISFSERADDPPSLPWLRLYYLRQNMERLASDWQQNWLNVGRE